MQAINSVRPSSPDQHQQSPQAQTQRLSPDSQCQPLASDAGTTSKPKSRWFYRCEQETSTTNGGTDDWGDDGSPSTTTDHNGVAFSVGGSSSSATSSVAEGSPSVGQAVTGKDMDLPQFEKIQDSIYLAGDRKKDKKNKPSRMICECSYEDALKSGNGCAEECLNRLLYYECGPNCPCGTLCTNLRFQKHQYSSVDAFLAGKKGFGLKACENIQKNTFIMEYVGEVLTASQFRHRTKSYAKDRSHKHHYFMALKSDEVIDATKKGNISRFINHSCDPNCETQKWTVNGHLRIGFFTIKNVCANEELTFDYKFQRYGKEAQKCYCGADSCRGYIDGGGDSSRKVEREESKRKDREAKNIFEDQLFDREFDDILSMGCLRNRDQVVTFGRLMLRADDFESRSSLLNLLMKTQSHILRLFIDLHGCTLLWAWMIDDVVSGDQWQHFQLLILDVLGTLPIPHKDILLDSRLLPVVERWSKMKSDAKDYDDEDKIVVVQKVVSDLISSVCLGIAYNFENKKEAIDVYKNTTLIKQKCSYLLAKWILLKENFKIPKKHEKSKASDSPIDGDSKDKFDKIIEKQTNSPKFSELTNNGAYTLANGLKGRLINSYTTGQNRHAVKRSINIFNAENDHSTKRIKEERRREFEAKFARQEELKLLERQRQIQVAVNEAARIDAQATAAAPFNFTAAMPVASTDSSLTPTLSSVVQPSTAFSDGASMFCGGLSSATPTFYDDSGLERPDALFLQGATPAELVHDSTTAQFWWMDRTSGVFVYPATDEQILAYQLGDIYSIPHFYQDPSTGLIHEVQVRIPSSSHQAPRSDWTSSNDNQNDISNISSTEPAKLKIFSHQTMAERIAALTNEIASLHKQLTCKQAELTELMEQVSSVNILQETMPLNESTPVQKPLSVGRLPKNWRMARDTDGKPYYYHTKTKKTQWNFPSAQFPHEQDDNIGTPSTCAIFQPEEESRRALPPASQPTARRSLVSAAASRARQAAVKRQRQRVEGLSRMKGRHRVKVAFKLKQMASRSRKCTSDAGEPLKDREDGEILPEDEAEIDTKLAAENSGSSPMSSVDENSVEDHEDDELVESENLGRKHSTGRQSQMSLEESPVVLKTTPCGTTTAAADTSSEVAKKFKEAFKAGVSNHIIKCLNPYRKSDCSLGHISSHDDFKHLARKLTHAIMEKELKHCHGLEDLKITDSVLHKAKDYIKRYMVKLGPIYKRSFGDDFN